MIDYKHSAMIHFEDGKKWVRIIPENGMSWDEPIVGWESVIYLTEGFSTLRNKDGREYPEVHEG